jgi:hypothetical protein
LIAAAKIPYAVESHDRRFTRKRNVLCSFSHTSLRLLKKPVRINEPCLSCVGIDKADTLEVSISGKPKAATSARTRSNIEPNKLIHKPVIKSI